MYTRIVDAGFPSALALAVQTLKNGGLVAFPTDTVYGLGALISLPESVARIFLAKGRPVDKAIPVLLSDLCHLALVASDIPDVALHLAEAFWPGGLTLVLHKAASVSPAITAGGDTVAVRIPNHPVALELMRLAGTPLAVTSANRSGAQSPKTALEVQTQLAGWIELILDGGPVPGGVESTVLDLTGRQPIMLREGAISADELEKVIGQRPVAKEF